MANKMHKSFLCFVIYVLVIAVQLMQVVEGNTPCTIIQGRCAPENCQEKCTNYGAGTSSTLLGSNCNFYNLCTCVFDRPPFGSSCKVGIGLCSSQCGDSCCDGNCKARYIHTGTGKCVHDFDTHLYYCNCVYQR
ncbi:defensin-like protein 183 [Vicia villosa]|uniref:defensin-like protein 183 n=1 Tax=Vicia villosa TaxID=3911 RepID=UPI00273A755E|nr:defensin-like protein 183 [Vicia villosa]